MSGFPLWFSSLLAKYLNYPARISSVKIKPNRNGWKVFEAPEVEPVFLQKDQAINYAQNRVVS